jgi:hypothetical protein
MPVSHAPDFRPTGTTTTKTIGGANQLAIRQLSTLGREKGDADRLMAG